MAIHKARKTHYCDLCQREIQKGERYVRINIDEYNVRKECINCEDHTVSLTACETQHS